MKNLNIIILFLSFSLFACRGTGKKADEKQKNDSSLVRQELLEECNLKRMLSYQNHNVAFSIKSKHKEKNTFEIYAGLKNLSNDTVYYLDRSCNGFLYFIDYDPESISEIRPQFFCNYSNFIITSIPPDSSIQLPFFYLELKEGTRRNIDLGFKFIETDKAYFVNSCFFKDLGNTENLKILKAIPPQ